MATKLGYTGTVDRPARPQYAYRLCCVVCGFPSTFAAHLPLADLNGNARHADAYDHEFIAPHGSDVVRAAAAMGADHG